MKFYALLSDFVKVIKKGTKNTAEKQEAFSTTKR